MTPMPKTCAPVSNLETEFLGDIEKNAAVQGVVKSQTQLSD